MAARGCHCNCNEVPAGLLVIPLPRVILELSATVLVTRRKEPAAAALDFFDRQRLRNIRVKA
jgi:hypothetical protein